MVSISIATSIDCSHRNKGGWGLNSLAQCISRLVSKNSDLMKKPSSNTYLALVFNHDKESLVRAANQFVQCFSIQAEPNEPPKKLSFKIKQKMKENHLKIWLTKPQHGYLFRSREDSNQVNESATHLWLKKSSFSSHIEGYLAIQDEEIFTRSLQLKRLTGEQIYPMA